MALFLPDTNILLAYTRNNALASWVETQYGLLSQQSAIISVVCEAELRALAHHLGWSGARLRRLEALLAALMIVPIPYQDIIAKYAEIDSLSRRKGRPMGKNDIWIAATAYVTGATLLTTDRDFDHLSPEIIQLDWIDPAQPDS